METTGATTIKYFNTSEKQSSNGAAIILNKTWGNLVESTIHCSDRLTAIKLNTDNGNNQYPSIHAYCKPP